MFFNREILGDSQFQSFNFFYRYVSSICNFFFNFLLRHFSVALE